MLTLSNEIYYRLSGIGECEKISSLLNVAFGEFKTLYNDKSFRATTPTPNVLRKRFNEGPVWVADYNNKIIGTITGKIVGKGLYLRSMAVNPRFQGKQIGFTLLKKTKAYALEHHLMYLCLSTTPFLQSAIHLYQKFGFKTEYAEESELFETPLIYMKKYL